MNTVMRNILIFLLFLCSVAYFVGCMSPKDKAENIISAFKEKKVVLPYQNMSCWINDSIQNNRPWEDAKMKLVIYVDSTRCSECTLKTMYMWEDFVKMEEEYNSEFSLVFIFQIKLNTDPKVLASLFRITELNHPMYIDNKNIFSKSNPHVPQESLYHIFLLDENNNVVLVGNPLFNPKIENMLRNEVKKQLNRK